MARVVVGLLVMASWSLYREVGRRARGLRRRPAGSSDVLDDVSSPSIVLVFDVREHDSILAAICLCRTLGKSYPLAPF